jgi:hypothetical protein
MKAWKKVLLSVLLVTVTFIPVFAGVGRAETYSYQSTQSLTTATIAPVDWHRHYWHHDHYWGRPYGYYRPYYDGGYYGPYYDPYYYNGPSVSFSVPGFSFNYGY